MSSTWVKIKPFRTPKNRCGRGAWKRQSHSLFVMWHIIPYQSNLTKKLTIKFVVNTLPRTGIAPADVSGKLRNASLLWFLLSIIALLNFTIPKQSRLRPTDDPQPVYRYFYLNHYWKEDANDAPSSGLSIWDERVTINTHLDHVMLPATGGRFREIGGSCFCFS